MFNMNDILGPKPATFDEQLKECQYLETDYAAIKSTRVRETCDCDSSSSEAEINMEIDLVHGNHRLRPFPNCCSRARHKQQKYMKATIDQTPGADMYERSDHIIEQAEPKQQELLTESAEIS